MKSSFSKKLFYSSSSFKFFNRLQKKEDINKGIINYITEAKERENIKENTIKKSKSPPILLYPNNNQEKKNFYPEILYPRKKVEELKKTSIAYNKYHSIFGSYKFNENNLLSLLKSGNIPITLEEVIVLFQFSKQKKKINFLNLLIESLNEDFKERYKSILSNLRSRKGDMIFPKSFIDMFTNILEYDSEEVKEKLEYIKCGNKYNKFVDFYSNYFKSSLSDSKGGIPPVKKLISSKNLNTVKDILRIAKPAPIKKINLVLKVREDLKKLKTVQNGIKDKDLNKKDVLKKLRIGPILEEIDTKKKEEKTDNTTENIFSHSTKNITKNIKNSQIKNHSSSFFVSLNISPEGTSNYQQAISHNEKMIRKNKSEVKKLKKEIDEKDFKFKNVQRQLYLVKSIETIYKINPGFNPGYISFNSFDNTFKNLKTDGVLDINETSTKTRNFIKLRNKTKDLPKKENKGSFSFYRNKFMNLLKKEEMKSQKENKHNSMINLNNSNSINKYQEINKIYKNNQVLLTNSKTLSSTGFDSNLCFNPNEKQITENYFFKSFTSNKFYPFKTLGETFNYRRKKMVENQNEIVKKCENEYEKNK